MIGIFEAVKRGFGIASKSLSLVLVLIVFNLIGNIASMPFAVAPGQTPPPEAMTGALIFTVVFILISIFMQGGALGLVRDSIKEGKIKLSSFASYGAKYYLRLLGLGVIIILAIAIVAIIASLAIALTAPLGNQMISSIAIVAAIAIGVITSLLYFIPFALAPYALICEELGIIKAIKRSLAVAGRPLVKVFMLILLFIILILISLGVGLVFGFLVGLITAAVPEMIGKMLMAVVTSVINGYLGIVMMAAFMVFYLGLSAKTEKKVV